MDKPQAQDQELEVDLSFGEMDLVPYISPLGEYKTWDRNDPDDYEAAEEIKLCGSDKQREDDVEAWKAVRTRQLNQEKADAKATAEKEENDWYLEYTGMTAAEWKAQDAKQKAAKEAKATALNSNTPATTTKPSAVPSMSETPAPSIRTADTHHPTTAAADTHDADNILEAELIAAFEADHAGLTAPEAEIHDYDHGVNLASDAGNENGGVSMEWGRPKSHAPTDAVARDQNDGDDFQAGDEDGGVTLVWSCPKAPPVDTEVRDIDVNGRLEFGAGEEVDGASMDWGSPEPQASTHAGARDDNDGDDCPAVDAALDWGSLKTPADTEVHDHGNYGGFEAGGDDGGASLDWGSPTALPDASTMHSHSTGVLSPQQTEQSTLTAKELFEVRRKEKNREKRVAKKAAQTSTHPTSTPPKKTTKATEKAAQASSTTKGTSTQSSTPKRKYKPRAKKAVQATTPVPKTPAPNSQINTAATEPNEEDDDGFEAELWAALEAKEKADASAPMSNEEDDDGLEAELLAVLEAKAKADAGGPLSNGASSSTGSTAESHVPSSSPSRGSTSFLGTALSPGTENEANAESDLGSDMSPEEWAAMNGESSSTTAEADGQGSSAPLTTIGKTRVEKKKKKSRNAVIRALRWETLNPQKTTSLDQAVVHIQSKPAAKAREIFIDTTLSDIVIHGRKEVEDMITKDDNSVLPKLYHVEWKDGPNYRLLGKHMDLHEDVKLNEVFVSLGLDISRGKSVFTQIQKLLKTPGCSLRIDGDLVDEHKITIGERAHQLLAVVGWGYEHFSRPALSGRDNKEKLFDKVSWGTASTHILLEFSKLLYKAAKLDEARRKGKNRRTYPVKPAAPEPTEPQPFLPISEVPALIAPIAAAPGPGAPFLSDHARSGPPKRAHATIDLTSDAEEVVRPSPSKRACFSSQQSQKVQRGQNPQQVHHSQNLEHFLPQITAFPSIPVQQTQSRQHPQVLTQNSQIQQRFQALPQSHIPQHIQAQYHQAQSHQAFENRHTLPQRQTPRRPQALPLYQSPQSPQVLNQYQSPQRPQALPRFHYQGPQHVQAQNQPARDPQRPWAHLQTRHNSLQLPLQVVNQLPQMQQCSQVQGRPPNQSPSRPQAWGVQAQAQETMNGFW